MTAVTVHLCGPLFSKRKRTLSQPVRRIYWCMQYTQSDSSNIIDYAAVAMVYIYIYII